MEGSLGKQGDSHAEQNHSSIVAHLGNGGTLNLAGQVCHLIKRHKSNVLRRQQADYALTITSSNYKSKYSSLIKARDDKNAKKTLSSFAYKQFTECLQHARRVQFREDSDGIYTVWPVNKSEEETSDENIHCFSRETRCLCTKRKQMLIQCGHELKVFGFKMGEWSNRWYSNSTYCEQAQNLFRTGFFSSLTAVAPEPVDEDDDGMVVDDECVAEVINVFSDRQVRVVQAEDGHDKDEVEEIPIVKISEVISTFNTIASHVQNDQPELVKLLAFAQGVLKSYRKGLTVDLDFTTEGQENQIPTATSKFPPRPAKGVVFVPPSKTSVET
jgi:hypothetical protein